MAVNNTTKLTFIKKGFTNITGTDNNSSVYYSQTAGRIVFDSTHKIICVDGQIYGGNIQDATFANNILKIWKSGDANNSPSISIDFTDVASARSTLAIFAEIADKMGLTGSDNGLDYSGTNYLSSLGTQGTTKNLVNADKELDKQIKEKAVVTTGTNGNYNVPTYGTSGRSEDFGTAVTNGTVSNNDTAIQAINKIDNKLKAVVDEINNLDGDAVHDVKINGTSIVSNKEADIEVDGTYNSSTNKIATQNTVKNKIETLDVNEFTQAEIDTTTNSGETSFKVKSIKEVDGKIEAGAGTTDIKIDGTYNSSTNKIATQSTIVNAINDLDTTNDVNLATESNDIVTLTGSIKEENGIIDKGQGTDIVLAKVAKTGSASDVTYNNGTSGIGGTEGTLSVQTAIDRLDNRIDSLEGGYDTIIVVEADGASKIPQGVIIGSTTGLLEASSDTFHKIYLVSTSANNDGGTYAEYITVRTSNNGSYSYSWEKLGEIGVSLKGYLKSVTINGKAYEAANDSNNITIQNIITAITGESSTDLNNTSLVNVKATETHSSVNGTRTVALVSSVKTHTVSDATSGDGDGLATALDTKTYVDTKSAVVNSHPTIIANVSEPVQIGTVGGNALTAAVQLNWDEWETNS